MMKRDTSKVHAGVVFGPKIHCDTVVVNRLAPINQLFFS
jgi:hypothetical protein